MFAVFDNVMFTKRGNIRVERKELHSLWNWLMYETFCLRVVKRLPMRLDGWMVMSLCGLQ